MIDRELKRSLGQMIMGVQVIGAADGDVRRLYTSHWFSQIAFDDEGRVFIAGTDVTSAIRQSRIDRMVPVVARHHDVREVMRERQRELAG